MPELCGLSIAQAAQLLAAKDISALELTEAYLARIDALDPQINAYITVSAGRALEDARRASDEMLAGKARGPLHGIPVGRPFDEALVLRAAHAYEQATEWHLRMPEL